MTSLQKSLEVYLQSRALILSEDDAYRNILISKLVTHANRTFVILDPLRTYAAGKANLICFDDAFELIWQAELPPAQGNILRAYRELAVGDGDDLRVTDCGGTTLALDIRSGRIIGKK